MSDRSQTGILVWASPPRTPVRQADALRLGVEPCRFTLLIRWTWFDRTSRSAHDFGDVSIS